jgi:hypothetical protein
MVDDKHCVSCVQRKKRNLESLNRFRFGIIDFLNFFVTILIRVIGAVVLIGGWYFSKNFVLVIFSVPVQNVFFACGMFAGLLLLMVELKIPKRPVVVKYD